MSPSEVSKSTDMVLTRYGRYRPEWLEVGSGYGS